MYWDSLLYTDAYYKCLDITENSQSLKALINETAAHRFDMVLHVGDIGYDMEDNSSLIGGTASRLLSFLVSVL